MESVSRKKAWTTPKPARSAVLAREIVESLETALEQFRCIEDELKDSK